MNKEINVTDLSTKLWKANHNRHPIIEYDDVLDMLNLFFVEPGDGLIVTHYIDQFVAVLYTHENKEIVGMSIEDFEMSFVPRFAGRPAWRLSDSGVQLNGVRDVVFGLQKEVKHAQVKQRAEKIEFKKEISLQQQYAFS
ncbi:MAG: hypothetical protein WA821_02880 [Anaerolineales bacterium]